MCLCTCNSGSSTPYKYPIPGNRRDRTQVLQPIQLPTELTCRRPRLQLGPLASSSPTSFKPLQGNPPNTMHGSELGVLDGAESLGNQGGKLAHFSKEKASCALLKNVI